MATPPVSLPSAAVLRELLRQARDGTDVDAILSTLMDQSDAGFELLPEGSELGSMTDASKRRMTTPPQKGEKEQVMSGAEAEKNLVSSSPDSFGMKLPVGIKDLHHWGNTLLEVGKFGKEGMSYFEISSSTKQVHQSYCTWLVSQRFRVDLTPPMKDLIRYLHVKNQMSQPEDGCFDGSTVRRTMKA